MLIKRMRILLESIQVCTLAVGMKYEFLNVFFLLVAQWLKVQLTVGGFNVKLDASQNKITKLTNNEHLSTNNLCT